MSKKKFWLITILVLALSLFAACGDEGDSTPDEHVHVYSYDLSASTAPTEEADGEIIGTCECGDVKTVSVPKLTNTLVWSVKSETSATCKDEGARVYTSLYGDVTVTLPVDSALHDLSDVAAKSATCVDDGVIAHKHCSVCGKNFDDNGAEIADVTVKGTHSLTDVEATAHDCTTDGVIAHKHCSVCEKNFDADGNELDSIVDPAAHTLVDVAAKPATCVEDGVIAHKHCSVCEKNFDADGNELADVTVKGSHTLVDVAAKPATCKDYAITVAHKKCSVCQKLFVGDSEVLASEVYGTELAGHSYGSYGECTVCGSLKFANVKYAVVRTGYWGQSYMTANGNLTLSDAVATDTLINAAVTDADITTCYYSDCTYSISNPTLTFAFADKQNGILKITSSYTYVENHEDGECKKDDVNEVKTIELIGYYDAQTNVIVIPGLSSGEQTDFARVYILVPSDAEPDTSLFDTASWGDMKLSVAPVTYTSGDVKLNIFVDGANATVHTGVSFEDIDGNALNASAMQTAKVFRVVKNGELIASYGVADGKVVVLDGLEGTYIGIDDPDEQAKYTAIIDGNGNIIYGYDGISADDNYKGALIGTYTVIGGTTDKIAVFFTNEEGENAKYYEITVNASEKTATATMPQVSIIFTGDLCGTTTVGVNKNIPFTIPSAENDGFPDDVYMNDINYRFVGWKKADGSTVLPGSTLTLTEDLTLTADYRALINLTVKDTSNLRSDVTVTVLASNSVLEALKDQYGLEFDGIIIDGEAKTLKVKYWYVAIEGGEDVIIDESTEVTEADMGAVLYVMWKPDVNFMISDSLMGDDTVAIGTDDLILKGLPARDDYIDGYKFEGWYFDSSYENKISENAQATEEMANSTVYAKYVWGGDIAFELGSSYTFVYDEEIGAFKSNNYHVNSADSSMVITAVDGAAVVTFEYFYSSENSDKFSVYYFNADGKYGQHVNVGGNGSATIDDMESWGWLSVTAYLDVNNGSDNQLRISYKKDGSVHTGLDTAYIRNLTINGRVITNAAPIDQLKGTYSLGAGTAELNGNGIMTYTDGSGTSKINYTVLAGANDMIAYYMGEMYYESEIVGSWIYDRTPIITLTYSTDGKDDLASLTVSERKNNVITLAVPSDTESYRFAGWYKDEDLTKKVTTDTFVLSENTMLYAKWENAVTVIFDNDGVQETKTGYFVNDTVKSEDITEVSKDDHRFDGWYTKDAEGNWGSKVDSSTVITEENTVFYAKYSEKVTFTWMDGDEVIARELSEDYYVGDNMTVYADRAGLTDETKAKKWVGWYTADGRESGEWGTSLGYSTVLSSSKMTFYAKWNYEVVVSIYDGENLFATLYGKDHGCYIGDGASSSIYNYGKTDAYEGKKWVGIYTKDGSSDGDWGDTVSYSIKLNDATATFYVRFYYAATVKFMNGEEVVKEVTGKYEHDKLDSSDIPAAITENIPEGKVFGGWCLEVDGVVTEDEASTSRELGLTNIYKARFIDPSPLAGTYAGFEVWSNSISGRTLTTVKNDWSVSGLKTGKIKNYDAETGTFVFVVGSSEYFGYYDAEAQAFAFNYSSGVAKGLGNDTYVYLVAESSLTLTKVSLVNYDSNTTRIMTVQYGSDEKVFVMRSNKLYADVTVTATDIAGNVVDIASAKIITVTRGGEEVTKFSIDGTTTSDNIPTDDGFTGSYTLSGDDTPFVLDGKGGYTHGSESGTYVVNGTGITLTSGDNSVTYGINVEDKTFATVSAFAGLTFTGSYYDDWDKATTPMRIEFAMSADITGTIYRSDGTSFYFDFTATLSGNEITFTFTKTIDGSSVGKTLVGTISGGTITFTSWYKTSGTYTFANNGSVTCEGFSL